MAFAFAIASARLAGPDFRSFEAASRCNALRSFRSLVFAFTHSPFLLRSFQLSPHSFQRLGYFNFLCCSAMADVDDYLNMDLTSSPPRSNSPPRTSSPLGSRPTSPTPATLDLQEQPINITSARKRPAEDSSAFVDTVVRSYKLPKTEADDLSAFARVSFLTTLCFAIIKICHASTLRCNSALSLPEACLACTRKSPKLTRRMRFL